MNLPLFVQIANKMAANHFKSEIQRMRRQNVHMLFGRQRSAIFTITPLYINAYSNTFWRVNIIIIITLLNYQLANPRGFEKRDITNGIMG